jgi:hypothetical protein
MINVAGKQAIKNGELPGNQFFSRKGLGVRCKSAASRLQVACKSAGSASTGSVRAKYSPLRGSQGRKMNIEGSGGYGGNRTLTLSRHNPCHRGRRVFRSSPGCEAERGGAACSVASGE